MTTTIAALIFACGGSAATAQGSPTAAVAIFAGQSNEESHGTNVATYGFAGIPGGVASAGINAAASCWETTATPLEATPGSGTLICAAPNSGALFAGQVVKGAGVPTGQVISAAANGGNFPGATGTGANAGGSYVVTPAAQLGSVSSPLAMTFSQPDIGGSGVSIPRCVIWSPDGSASGGNWQNYAPNVNSNFSGAAQTQGWGPEGPFCQRWTAANPGRSLYMIKLAVGGSSLCDLPSGNNYSPEYVGSPGIGGFSLLSAQISQAEAALKTQLGISKYQIALFQWGQGEQDAQNAQKPCGFPMRPFSPTTTPVPYLENLKDLIGRFAIPSPINATFTGSIAGPVLTVAHMTSGSLHVYQLVSGSGILPATFITGQITGTPGGVGTYSLQVYQATTIETISASSGARCSRAMISGKFLQAFPIGYTAQNITASCVAGGAFGVGQTLSGNGVLTGSVITSLDSAGDTADGLYVINVNQTVASTAAPVPLKADVGGFGAGASKAVIVLFRTFLNSFTSPGGVRIAQNAVNNSVLTALPVTVVNTDDALKATLTEIHFHAAWITELGRRLYLGYIGRCDYNSPTC